MPRSQSGGSRRQFLKYAGSTVAATAIAGCMGGTDGQDGAGTSPSKERKVRLILSPFGFAGIIYDQMINKTDRLTSRMAEAGYAVEAKESWQNSTLFAAGGPDFSDMGSLEAATLAGQRDLNLAVNGRMASYFVGIIVKIGGPYDPENTGGEEASMRKIAEGGKFAIGSWSGGDVQAYQVVMPERFGLTFSEEGGDFEVVTADYFALPKLVENGEVAAVSTAPHYGAAPMFASEEPTLKGLFWTSDLLSEMGYGTSMINSWVSTQEFADEHPNAVEAVVGAWQETVADFVSRPYELATTDEYMEMLAAENEQQARWLIDWGVKGKYGYQTPCIYEQTPFTDELIEKEKQFIGASADMGNIPSDWEDRLEFRKVSV